MRRVAIIQQVQNPPRCQRVEDLGAALEDWLSEKRQYEMFTDRNGRPCQASDDSLVAMFRLMPNSLKETGVSSRLRSDHSKFRKDHNEIDGREWNREDTSRKHHGSSKPLLSAAEVSKRGDSLLFEDG